MKCFTAQLKWCHVPLLSHQASTCILGMCSPKSLLWLQLACDPKLERMWDSSWDWQNIIRDLCFIIGTEVIHCLIALKRAHWIQPIGFSCFTALTFVLQTNPLDNAFCSRWWRGSSRITHSLSIYIYIHINELRKVEAEQKCLLTVTFYITVFSINKKFNK